MCTCCTAPITAVPAAAADDARRVAELPVRSLALVARALSWRVAVAVAVAATVAGAGVLSGLLLGATA